MTEPSEKLFEEVMADARTKADRTARRGRRDAEALGRKIDQEARAAAERILADARAEAALRRDQTIATVAVEAQREELAGLEEDLQRVREAIRQRLAAIDAGRMRQAQARLALEALAQLPAGDAEVALPARQHAEYGPALVAELAAEAAQKLKRVGAVRLADQPADIPDGVVVRAADGRMEVVETFSQRLHRLWPELRLQVAARLFPDRVKPREK
jgi:vacuolar-type H+-ATPase subunit E/Vma4